MIFFKNLFEQLKLKKQENFFILFLFLISFFLSFYIFLLISGYVENLNQFYTVSILLKIDLFVIVIISILIFFKVKNIWNSRKENQSGSNLHIQLSTLFGVITLIPSILVTIFSILFFDQGVKTWFAKKVYTAISGSKFISESYFKEHSSNLKNDLVFLSQEINNEKVAFFTDKVRLTSLLESLTAIKLLDEIIIFERSGQLLAKIGNSFVIDKEPPPPLWTIFRADDGEISIFTNDENDKVRGLIKLDRVIPTYLYAGKNVDSLVISRVNSVNEAANQYMDLEKNIEKFQNQFYQLFIAINFLVILLSVWFGLLFANKVVFPIKLIISASEKISSGDLKTRIQSFSRFKDLNTLSDSFNSMVEKLLQQKNKLLKAKETINSRRKFTETILEGVSAGIIYLDKKYSIILHNKKSEEILNRNINKQNIFYFFPEIENILVGFERGKNKTYEEQIRFSTNENQKIINLRISPQIQKNNINGYILTFDDVSELVSAQKKAAWSNVARYLAHEIKNPLTPIKISAQRLQINFKKNSLDNKVFDNCTQTIVRQVNDIEKLVTEFSDFARMPSSKFSKVDFKKIITQQIDTLKLTHKNINFIFNCKYNNLFIKCDKSQISRVLINLFKNSIEACSVIKKRKSILIEIFKTKKYIEFTIEDNGIGFPKESDKFFEPYMTNKAGGTGLGLSICKKIIDEHTGEIALFSSKKLGGGGVKIILPL